VGLGFFALFLYTLPNDPYVNGQPWLLLVALVLVLGAIAWEESDRLRLPTSSRPTTRSVAEALCVICLIGLFYWFNTFDLENWYYSCIGDEHAFYGASMEMAEGRSNWNLFSQKGVYGYHPVLSSYWSGLQMRFLLGVDGSGWKAAVVFTTCLSLLVGYLLIRQLFGVRLGLMALGILSTCHYLYAYAHTGYNNLEALLPSAAALLCLIVGLGRGSSALLILSGVWAGLGWYTFYSARASLILLGAVLAVAVRPRSWIPVGTAILFGFGLLFLPFFKVNQGDLLTRMVSESWLGGSTEAVANLRLLPIWNLGRSLLAFNYNAKTGHYLTGSLVEPLTAALFLLGVGAVLARGQDIRNRLILCWIGIGFMVTGVLSKHDHVSVSRMHFIMIPVASIAALALDRLLVRREQSSGESRAVETGVVVTVVLLLVAGSNFYRWFVKTPAQYTTTADSLVIRTLDQTACQTAALPPLVVDVGVGGALPPALRARSGTIEPEYALYSDPPLWIENLPSRCVILRNPRDQRAQDLTRIIQQRWPDAVGVEERDLSGNRSILVFYPAAVSDDSRLEWGA
jgi:hypothetical protein